MCGIYGYLLGIDNDILDIIQAGYSLKKNNNENTITIHNNNLLLMSHQNNFSKNIYNVNDTYYYVLFEGEIYNREALYQRYLNGYTNNIIYPLFELFDYDFNRLNNELNGDYSLAIIKVVSGNLTDCWLSVDQLSIKPLFVYSDENHVAFSSLLSALINTPNINKSKVLKLSGGDSLHFTFKHNKVYSELSTNYKKDISNEGLLNPILNIDEIKTQLVFSLQSSVIRRINTDKEIGCFLSGSLDSSLIASIACKELKEKGKKLKTFTIGTTGSSQLYYGKLVADYIGSEHSEIILDNNIEEKIIEDIIKTIESSDTKLVSESIPYYILSKWVYENTNVKVILTGDGSDECLMGDYKYYYSSSHTESHKECINNINNIHLYTCLKAERCLNRWGLEMRFPFLDKGFVNLCSRIHPKIKLPSLKDGKITKWILRSAFQRYLDIPEEILWKDKNKVSYS
jgi:asparagine synthase (glutamine-hydrolysing)